jgi:hypothetical protein
MDQFQQLKQGTQDLLADQMVYLVITFSMLSFNLSFEPCLSLLYFSLLQTLSSHSHSFFTGFSIFPLLVILILTTNDSCFMTITNALL